MIIMEAAKKEYVKPKTNDMKIAVGVYPGVHRDVCYLVNLARPSIRGTGAGAPTTLANYAQSAAIYRVFEYLVYELKNNDRSIRAAARKVLSEQMLVD